MNKFEKLNQIFQKTRNQIILGILLLLILTTVVSFNLPLAQAAPGINKQINYQGKMSTASGATVTNASWSFRFRIYDASSNGSLLWTERWNSTTTPVTTINGVFSVALGSLGQADSLDSINWNSDSLYLQIDLDADNNGTWEESFNTRKQFTSATYSFNSDMIDGIHATSTAAVANYLMALDSNAGLTVNGVTSTANLNVSGSSTLATTTMAYDSYIGNAGDNITVSSMPYNGGFLGSGSFPVITFNSSNAWAAGIGGFTDNLSILQISDEDDPVLRFVNKDFADTLGGGNIGYATTSNTFYLNSLAGGNVNLFVYGNQTTTGSLQVSDIATLATTTLRYGSKIGDSDGSSYFTVESTNFNDPGNIDLGDGIVHINEIPLIKFHNSSEIVNNNQGLINGGLILVEAEDGDGSDSDFPILTFAAKDIANILVNGSSANIYFDTTTNSLNFNAAAGYNFFNGAITKNYGLNYGSYFSSTFSPTADSSAYNSGLGVNTNVEGTEHQNYLSGISIAAGYKGTASLTSLVGVYAAPELANFGSVTSTVGVDVAINNGLADTTGGGDMTQAAGLSLAIRLGPRAGTVGTYRAINLATPIISSGSITDAYGLYMADINNATGNNYAIYTGAGDTRLGDDLQVVGNATTSGYLTVGAAPTDSNFASGNLNVEQSLVVGNGITLGGVFRNTWPTDGIGGAGSYWVTSTDELIGYPNLAGTYAITIGSSATTTGISDNIRLEVLNGDFGADLAAGNNTFFVNGTTHSVGIATTTPWQDYKLAVLGSGIFTGNIRALGSFIADTEVRTPLIHASSTDFDALKVYGSGTTTGTFSASEYFIGGEKTLSTSAGSNIIVGPFAGQNYTGTWGSFLGYYAGYNATKDNLTAIGSLAGYNSTGSASTFIGAQAGYDNTRDNITAVGAGAASLNTGYDTIALGAGVAYLNSGNYAIAIGDAALTSNTGSNVIGLGHFSAYGNTGTNVIAIGTNAAYGNNIPNNYSHVIALGLNAMPTADHQLVVGDFFGAGYIADGYFGSGVTTTAPYDFTFHGSGGYNGDISGADLRMVGGLKSGSGLDGNVILAHDGTNQVGSVGIATSTPWAGYKLAVEGTSMFNGNIDIVGNATTTGRLVIGTTNPTWTMAAGDLYIGNNATATGKLAASGGNSDQWNTAYGWGDPALTYLTQSSYYATTTWAGGNNNLVVTGNQTTTGYLSVTVNDYSGLKIFRPISTVTGMGGVETYLYNSGSAYAIYGNYGVSVDSNTAGSERGRFDVYLRNTNGSDPTNQTPRFSVGSAGNATITNSLILGTTNPTWNMGAGDLYFTGNATTTGKITASGGFSTVNQTGLVNDAPVYGLAQSSFTIPGAASVSTQLSGYYGLSFITGSQGTTNPGMVLTNTGKIGIATTTPGTYYDEKLAVVGDTYLNGNMIVSGKAGFNGQETQDGYGVTSKGYITGVHGALDEDGGPSGFLGINLWGVKSGVVGLQSSGDYAGYFIGPVHADYLYGGTSEEFQVDDNGDILKINNIDYSWPASQGASGTYLKNNGAGTLTWDTPTGSGTVNTGLVGNLAYYPSDGTTVDDLAAVNYQSNGNLLSIATTTDFKGALWVQSINGGVLDFNNLDVTNGATTTYVSVGRGVIPSSKLGAGGDGANVYIAVGGDSINFLFSDLDAGNAGNVYLANGGDPSQDNGENNGTAGNAGTIIMAAGGKGPASTGRDGLVIIGNDDGNKNAILSVYGNVTTTGSLSVGNPPGFALGTGDIYATGNATTSGKLVVGTVNPSSNMTAGDVFIGGNSTTTANLTVVGLNTQTTANAANVYVDANGLIYKSTSSLKYKTDVNYNGVNGDLVYQLQPASFKEKNSQSGQEYLGFIAEDVALVEPRLVVYDKDGNPDALQYANFTALLTKALQDQKVKIDELTDQLNVLQQTVNNSSTPELIVVSDPNLNIETLAVAQTATFYGTIYVKGDAEFEHKVVFKEDIEVLGKIYASKDQAGTTVILANTTSTEIIFEKEYEVVPKIVANLSEDEEETFINWKIIKKTAKGFVILLQGAVPKDLTFDWIALAVKADGTQPVADNTVPPTDNNPPTEQIFGCTDSNATNYNPSATQNDNSCLYPQTDPIAETPIEPQPILGCMDQTATNYNPIANQDDGSCQLVLEVSDSEEPIVSNNPPTETGSETSAAESTSDVGGADGDWTLVK